VTNAEIAKTLSHVATMLEMDGGNPFRVRAYREAARVIEYLPEPAAQLAKTEGRLREIRGIGKDLEGKIRDLVTQGTMDVYAELSKKYPPSLMELTELPGLGPKRVKVVFEQLGIRSAEDLAKAAQEHRLRDLPGFGETTENKLLKALGALAEAPAAGRVLLHAAWAVSTEISAAIAKVPGVERVEVAGSFRRRRETVGDLDVLVIGKSAPPVMEAFTTHPYVHEVLAKGDTRSAVRLGNGLQVDLRLVPAESFGAAMLYFTGSKAHNIELRKIAIDGGMSLNEYGLTKGDQVVAARTEEEVYGALGLPWIPPELREGHDEIPRARRGALPKLIEESDLRGDLHMHTDRSDGRDTLTAMVRAARDRGYAYCAITDHSGALGMTRGFDDARVRESVNEIEAVRREVPGIEVLHGLEVDILADGSLDLGDDALELLDWVIISLHSSLSQPRDVITRRVLRALDHPAVCVMGHPSGRKIGEREPANLDWERVFRRAAERGVAMEINAQPDRVDLSDVNARLAHSLGVRFLIDTDAHSTKSLEFMRYGVFQARRAGLEKDDVLNTLPFEKLDAWRRRQKGAPVPPRAPEPEEEVAAPAKARSEKQPSAKGAGSAKAAGAKADGAAVTARRPAAAAKARKPAAASKPVTKPKKAAKKK
jgi:DNA polymerase (family 10)